MDEIKGMALVIIISLAALIIGIYNLRYTNKKLHFMIPF